LDFCGTATAASWEEAVTLLDSEDLEFLGACGFISLSMFLATGVFFFSDMLASSVPAND
jgi:hypothetical protein